MEYCMKKVLSLGLLIFAPGLLFPKDQNWIFSGTSLKYLKSGAPWEFVPFTVFHGGENVNKLIQIDIQRCLNLVHKYGSPWDLF